MSSPVFQVIVVVPAPSPAGTGFGDTIIVGNRLLSGRDRKGPRLRPPNAVNKVWFAVNFNRLKTGLSQVLNNGIFREHAHLEGGAWSAVENEVPKFLDHTSSGPISQNKGFVLLDDREIIKFREVFDRVFAVRIRNSENKEPPQVLASSKRSQMLG